MIKEENFIELCTTSFPNDIGDDCACIPANNRESYLISKDLLVEDSHFRKSYFTPKDLANKALQVNLSDIAAMGGKPLYIMCGISSNKKDVDYAYLFMQEMIELCKLHNIKLIGGDTVSSSYNMLISITIIGIADNAYIKYRKKSNPGDKICYLGTQGYAYLGLLALEKKHNIKEIFKQKLLNPKAYLNEGEWLASSSFVTSMMDCSDGIYNDLPKLIDCKKYGFRVSLDVIDSNEDFIEQCSVFGLNIYDVTAVGAEDYGLIFTISSDYINEISEEFFNKFGSKFQVIGEVSDIKHNIYYVGGVEYKINLKSFEHFEAE